MSEARRDVGCRRRRREREDEEQGGEQGVTVVHASIQQIRVPVRRQCHRRDTPDIVVSIHIFNDQTRVMCVGAQPRVPDRLQGAALPGDSKAFFQPG